MVDVSVLIPIYNVEKYLSRCLNSVLNQKFDGTYEVICVNDGSMDKSAEILAQYAKHHSNLKIINQENQGLSVARNTGLAAAEGKYTLFVDSDDFIAENTLSSLYNFAEKHDSDVVIFDHLRGKSGLQDAKHYTADILKKECADASFNIDSAPDYFYDFINVRTWAKFYRTDLIKDVKFLEGVCYQDVPHWTLVYTKAKRIHYLPIPFYYYTIYRNDAASMNFGKKMLDIFVSYSETQRVLKETGYFDKLKNFHYARFGRVLVQFLRNIDTDLRKKFINHIKDFDFEIDYDSFENGNFSAEEKNNIKLIKYILEHKYQSINKKLTNIGIWKKWKYDVTIIMPVYNVEKYLTRCMESVTKQTFPLNRYEIICVNDGSTDNSLKILSDYAEKFKNVKVITQKNQGPAEARNTAIKKALGKYVLFVDSDDFIALNSLEVLYNYAEKHNSDVVVFDFYRDIPGVKNPKIRHQKNIAKYYGDKQFNVKTAENFVYRFIPMAPWNKFYRYDLIKDLRFIKETCFDDIPFWDTVYTKAERINYFPCVLYYYDVSRDTRLTASQDRKVFDVFTTYNATRKILEDSGYFEKLKYIVYAHAVSSFVNYLKVVKKELLKDYMDEIKAFTIDVSVDEFLKEDFYKFEYENFKLIKYIQEHNYDENISYLKENNYIK